MYSHKGEESSAPAPDTARTPLREHKRHQYGIYTVAQTETMSDYTEQSPPSPLSLATAPSSLILAPPVSPAPSVSLPSSILEETYLFHPYQHIIPYCSITEQSGFSSIADNHALSLPPHRTSMSPTGISTQLAPQCHTQHPLSLGKETREVKSLETTNQPESSPSSKKNYSQSYRMYKREQNHLNDESKRELFLAKNRQAAFKCRQKKKEWLGKLQNSVESLSLENERLQEQVIMLREEILTLRALLSATRVINSDAFTL